MTFLFLMAVIFTDPTTSAQYDSPYLYAIKSPQIMITGIVTAYSSTRQETDSDPFTMASGKRVYDGAIANNCLPFGTKVLIGGKEYTVWDRMNKRYGCSHYDLWHPDRQSALKFGKQQLTVIIK